MADQPADPKLAASDDEVSSSLAARGTGSSPLDQATGQPTAGPPRVSAPGSGPPLEGDWFRVRVDEHLKAMRSDLNLVLRRLDAQGAPLSSIEEQLSSLREITHSTERQLRERYEAMRRERDQLQRDVDAERRRYDELNRRFQDALKQLALSEGGKYTGPTGGHDELVQTFQKFKTQGFERLAQAIHKERSRPTGDPPAAEDRRRRLAEIKHALTRLILKEASGIPMPEEKAAADPREGYKPIIEAVEQAFPELKFSPSPSQPSVSPALLAVAQASVKLLQDMANARPPGLLLFAEKGERFDPKCHEACPGCPEEEGVSIEFTVFPGYGIKSPPRVWQRVVVFTAQTRDTELTARRW